MPKFPPGKLFDFFRYYDDSSPQCKEAVRRFERSLKERVPELFLLQPGELLELFRNFKKNQGVAAALEHYLSDKAPELLTDEAYWVAAWRKRTPAKQGPVTRSINLKDSVRAAMPNKVWQAQHTGDSCGQTSCAVAVDYMTGQKIDDNEWDRRHGYDLLGGLIEECPKHHWWDAGNFTADHWDDLLRSLAAGCIPILGMNGEDFSPSRRGHIIPIIGVTTTTAIFADPNGGELRELPRARFENAPPYPGGNFVFLALPK